MYRLSPCPVSGHHISVLPFLTIEFLIGCVINVALEVWTCKDVLDHLARIPIPDVVLCGPPLQMVSHFWEGAFVFEVGVLPPNITKINRVNLSMEIQMVGDRGRVAVRDQCCSP